MTQEIWSVERAKLLSRLITYGMYTSTVIVTTILKDLDYTQASIYAEVLNDLHRKHCEDYGIDEHVSYRVIKQKE